MEGNRMKEQLYNPHEEARAKGIKIVLVNFKTLNSFLTKSVIYLRDSMNRIEKRCTLTHELVHHSKNHFSTEEICVFHSREDEMEIRKITAQKLVSKSRLYELLEKYYSMDKIAEELEVTIEVLNDYLHLNTEESLEYASIK